MRDKPDYVLTRIGYIEQVVREFPSCKEEALMSFLQIEKDNPKSVKIIIEPKLGKLYNSWIVTTERVK